MENSSRQVQKAVVIYHDNCMDGFASAWAFHVLMSKNYQAVEYVPASYGDVYHPTNNHSDIYILDFSFPRDILTYIAENSNHITVLDHHKTAQEALTNWADKPKNVTIEFDMTRSGAGMTWDYFSKELRPPLIQYVEDRDLWKFQLPGSKLINALIAITPKTFIAYTNLSNNWNMDRYEEIGAYLNIQHQQICESIVQDARPIEIITMEGSYHGLACNCTGQFSSEVGNLLSLSGSDFGATYFSDKTGKVKWSLRSRGDYDVAKIAKSFGGGGHKNAAGFVISRNLVDGDTLVPNIQLNDMCHHD